MASGSAQKLKVLHVMDILRTETDPEHGLTMPQLIERLAARGVDAERKGIYRDIETLREFGMDIRQLKRHQSSTRWPSGTSSSRSSRCSSTRRSRAGSSPTGRPRRS